MVEKNQFDLNTQVNPAPNGYQEKMSWESEGGKHNVEYITSRITCLVYKTYGSLHYMLIASKVRKFFFTVLQL